MGFLETVGNAANRAKLNGEIKLAERDINLRKRAFGVELYDLIVAQNKKNASRVMETPSMFRAMQQDIKEFLESCSNDIQLLQLEKEQHENSAMLIDVRRDRDPNAGVGRRVQDTAKEAELAVKIKLIDRKMKSRKEQFGMEIWHKIAEPQLESETVSEAKPKRRFGGVSKMAKGVTKTLTKVGGEERGIDACVKKAKEEVTTMDERRLLKLRELERISG